MTEITEVDKEYIKSNSKWNRENDLLNDEIRLDISHTEEKIDIMKRQLEIYKERLFQNDAYKLASDKAFDAWLKDNNITKSDLIDL